MKNSTEESLAGESPPQRQNPSNGLLWPPTPGLVSQRTVPEPSFSPFWASAQQMSQHWGNVSHGLPGSGRRIQSWVTVSTEGRGEQRWDSVSDWMDAQNSVPCARCEKLTQSSPQVSVPARLNKWTKSQSSLTFSSQPLPPASFQAHFILRGKNARSEISVCAQRRCSLGKCGHWVRNEESWCVLSFIQQQLAQICSFLPPLISPVAATTGWEPGNSKSTPVNSCSLNLAVPSRGI